MTMRWGWAGRAAGLFSDKKGPWGSGGSNAGGGSGGDGPDGPGEPSAPSPWSRPPRGGAPRPSEVQSLEDWLKKRGNLGGPGGGLPGRPEGLVGWAIAAFVLLWLLFTTMHRIAPEERGVVTRFGRYQATLSPGIGLTLPSPIDRVRKVNVEEIRNIDLGSADSENLMLTGDQNIIDIAYQVRWSIREPEQYLYELAQPDETIRQVAESAMRQVVANVTLQDAMGNRRGDIEGLVQQEMQTVLDRYKSGVTIRGIAIKQADPPSAVNDSFKEVTAAQQEAQSYINQANAYSLQLGQKAQGDATAFDKVYEQYKLAPGVTKRRMYYETMERVLKGVDKTIVEAPGVQSYLPLSELGAKKAGGAK